MEMRQLPMGCYFTPKPYECINYLSSKVHGSQDVGCFWDGLIFDCDPYNPKQLRNIFSVVERRDNLYLFTKLRRKGKIGSVHVDRTIVGVGENMGTWRADQTREICDADNISVIGSARTFTFLGKKGDANDRRFLMTEYQLLTSSGNGNGHDSAALLYDPLKDHVLCHLRCASGVKGKGKGKEKKATKSINNLKMSNCALPLQSLPPLSSCPAANNDVTAEAFAPCSTTSTSDSASPADSLQTPTDSPIDILLANIEEISMEWDDQSYALPDHTNLEMDWVDLYLLTGNTGNDEDILPLSSSSPPHVHTDDPLALISVPTAINSNSSLVPEFHDSNSTAADNSPSYRHDIEPPTSVLSLANTAAIPSPVVVYPIPAFEDDYDTIFDTQPPINVQNQSNDLSWYGMSEFLDREELISCYNHPIFHGYS